MAHHTPKTKRTHGESRAARDQRALAQAQRGAARPTTPAPSAIRDPLVAPDQPPRYTFAWDAEDGSPLRPRYLGPNERPDLAVPCLRMLVNLTAEGRPTPEDLAPALLQEPPEALASAIQEGISRWHTYLPEHKPGGPRFPFREEMQGST